MACIELSEEQLRDFEAKCSKCPESNDKYPHLALNPELVQMLRWQMEKDFGLGDVIKNLTLENAERTNPDSNI